MSFSVTNALNESCQKKSYSKRLSITSFENPVDSGDFADDVKRGLNSKQKYLLPKYFYDSRGSQLFEKITRLKEYYPTEVERSIIKNISPVLPKMNPDLRTLVEIGSGSSDKTKHILSAFSETGNQFYYLPLDISEIVIDTSKNLVRQFKNIFIEGIIAEYENGLLIASEFNDEPKLYIFLGSSIGNFTFEESTQFLDNLNSIMNSEDRLLIGFDRIKKRIVLLDAYNDKKGITAEFNKNILCRINNELQADFNLNAFEHQARFNEEKSRIEMHLVSTKLQKVFIKSLNMSVQFQAGESIHTENSYKYTDNMINDLCHRSGFEVREMFTDEKKYFALYLFRKKA